MNSAFEIIIIISGAEIGAKDAYVLPFVKLFCITEINLTSPYTLTEFV